jgi:hypothetical protein
MGRVLPAAVVETGGQERQIGVKFAVYELPHNELTPNSTGPAAFQ